MKAPSRYGALAGTLILALASGALPAHADAPDFMERQIAVGRMSALIDRATEVLDGLDSSHPAPTPTDGDPSVLYRALYDAALDLERLRARACGARRIVGAVCAHRYEPGWLKVPGGKPPTLAQVSRWIDAFETAAMAVTGPICSQAPPDPEGPGACSVE